MKKVEILKKIAFGAGKIVSEGFTASRGVVKRSRLVAENFEKVTAVVSSIFFSPRIIRLELNSRLRNRL